MTLGQAVEVARQAGHPPPWRKLTIIFNTFPVFEPPGMNEIVFDLKKLRDGSEGVVVGSQTRRVRYYRRQRPQNGGNQTAITTEILDLPGISGSFGTF